MTYKELLFKMADKKMLTLSADKDGRGLFWAGMDNMEALEKPFDLGDFDVIDTHEDIYGESDNYEEGVAESDDFNEGYDAGFNDAKKALGTSVPKTAKKLPKRDSNGRFSK